MTDRFLQKLKRLVRKEFDRQAGFAFDQLNIRFVKKETKDLYDRLKKFNLDYYRQIASAGAEYAFNALPAPLKGKYEASYKKLNTGLVVASTLASYNFVTGYLYESEAERKRMRQAEEMLTAAALYSRAKYKKAMDRAATLWYQQSSQYAIDIEDEAVRDVWERAGVEEVMWITKSDDRVCETCRERHEQIYPIDEVPPKAHYNCRCILRPVWTEKS